MSGEVYAAAAACVALGAFIQGTIGVGFALIVVPVFAFLDRDLLPAGVLALMIPLNVYVIWRERLSIDWIGAKWITLGRLVGTLGGILILAALAPRELNVLIGIVTVLAAGVTLVAPHFDPGRKTLLTGGLIAGIAETATGVGGPPMALLYQHQPAPMLRATVASCFLIGQVFSLVVLTVTGLTSLRQITAAALLLPALAVGGIASQVLHRRLDGPWLRVSVLLFAAASGLALIVWG